MSGLIAHCGSTPVIAGGLFLTALIGSIAHCVPMCGPFILMQQSPDGTAGPLLSRLAGGLLLRYQLGRLITYTGLGAVAGAGGGWIVAETGLRWPLAALFAAAALAFLVRGIGFVLPPMAGPGLWLSRIIVPLAARNPGGFRLGLLLGLLPCGFLYAALAAAAATGSAVAGAEAMVAFAAGTVPALALVSLGGRAILRRWRLSAERVLAGLSLFNAVALSAAALRLLAF